MHSVFDFMVTVFILTVQIGLPCIVALLIVRPLVFRLTKWEKTVLRRVGVSIVSLLLVFASLAFWITHPPILCPKEFQEAFTQEKRAEARQLSRYGGGVFFPLVVSVLDIREDEIVTIEIQYGFLGGTAVLEYGGPDGINPIQSIH